jgi:uncharacterized lipoprotein YddW (UPF0748 family)
MDLFSVSVCVNFKTKTNYKTQLILKIYKKTTFITALQFVAAVQWNQTQDNCRIELILKFT